MKVLDTVKTTLIEVEQFASTITSVAAVAFSAIDTSALPPKYAAIVVGAANVTRIVDKALPNIKAKTNAILNTVSATSISEVEKEVEAMFGDTPASTPTPVATVPASTVPTPPVA